MSKVIWNKLNLGQHTKVFVLNAPQEFEKVIRNLPEGVTVRQRIGNTKQIDFFLAFVCQQDDIGKHASWLARAVGDSVVWFAYPKKSSKTYSSNISRDQGWSVLGKAGFEGVRQVAIDQDWSALRFRRIEFIKSLKRNEKMALSEEGKTRSRQNKKDRVDP